MSMKNLVRVAAQHICNDVRPLIQGLKLAAYQTGLRALRNAWTPFLERKLVSVVILLALAACGGDSPADPNPQPEPGPMQGSWVSDPIGPPGSTFSLSLTESASGDIAGTGIAFLSSTTADLIVTGTHVPPDITMVWDAPVHLTQDIRFSGTFLSDSVVTGLISGAGFVQTPITLRRQ